MVKIKIFFGSLFIAIFCSCNQNENNTHKYTTADTLHEKVTRNNPSNLTPLSFIQTLSNAYHPDQSIHLTTMMNDFPENWVTAKDIDSLLILASSRRKCNCFQNLVSSHIPFDNAEVGGFATIFINSFKQNKKVDLGFGACPKTDLGVVKELEEWWSKKCKGK